MLIIEKLETTEKEKEKNSIITISFRDNFQFTYTCFKHNWNHDTTFFKTEQCKPFFKNNCCTNKRENPCRETHTKKIILLPQENDSVWQKMSTIDT